MFQVTGEQLHDENGVLRAEARRGPVEVVYDGRAELVLISIEDYALLRENRKLAYLSSDMPLAKLDRIANAAMDAEHGTLDALMEE